MHIIRISNLFLTCEIRNGITILLEKDISYVLLVFYHEPIGRKFIACTNSVSVIKLKFINYSSNLLLDIDTVQHFMSGSGVPITVNQHIFAPKTVIEKRFAPSTIENCQKCNSYS